MTHGQYLPGFVATDQDGRVVRSSDFIGAYLVLFFYPRDLSLGCTREACAFRDAYVKLSELNTFVYGVSRDAPDVHLEFINRHALPFALLADQDEALHRVFDVRTQVLGIIRERKTFVFDPAGKLIDTYNSVISMGGHAEFALRTIEAHRAQLTPK